jgi:beta-lactamase regulating signal transducer with metallopeptidase domain
MTTLSLVLAAARGALVLGAALAAMPLLRRASAATRRLVLVFAFVAVALLPIATAALPPLRVALPAVEEPDARALAAASSPDPVARARASIGGASSSAAAREVSVARSPRVAGSPPPPVAIFLTLLALWAVGAAAVLARLGAGLWRARRLANAARLVAVERIGARSIEVRASAAIETPAVTGLFVPVVLLPRDAHTWSDERRHVVLLHELAHVARRDCLASAVVQLACAMHWYNPLAWIAARRLRMERELAADDRVLDAGARASSYAEHLLALATMHADVRAIPSGALAMAERSQVTLRIRALLTAGRSRAPIGRGRIAALGACAVTMVSAIACATPDRASSPAAPPTAPSALVQRRGGAPLDAIARAELTLDPALQAIAEDETDRLIAEWKARAAVVIVLDPQSGSVLALTSRAADATTEIAAQRAYVPGSTMKPFVVAAALEEGAIQPTQRFDCEHGEHAYGSYVLHDASPRGWLDVGGILAVSSNIGMAKIFDELGGAKLAAWTKRFHLDEATPLQLPGVVRGAVPSPIEDKSFRGATIAIGGGLTATPIQVAAAFSAIANGGVYHAPTLVRRADAGERVLREDTARTVMAMLEAVVAGKDGTGKAARVAGVRVAGKTGTANLAPEEPEKAEKPEKEDGAGDYYASFVGAAPLEHPRYVVLVGAEAPRDHGSGGQVAAPVFSRIVSRALAR